MIITNNEEALRVFCEPALPEEISSLIETLENELNYANRLGSSGIGLASPQIGIAKHIAIIRLPKLSLNLVNAKIKNGYDPAIFQNEGCLSFPNKTEDTLRYQEVHISNDVEPYNFIATGFTAVAIQHEIDHLNQTLIFDRKTPKINPMIKTHKIKPNDPCICGKLNPLTNQPFKYKKCCGGNK
jgi:peptide deformylase